MLSIETDQPLGAAAAAESILRVLTREGGWAPDKFGVHEPLHDRFEPENPSPFVAAWSGAARGSRMGSFHFEHRSRYQATVMWWPNDNRLSSLDFNFKVTPGDHGRITECLEFAHDIFDAAHGQCGHLCDREEYWSKNVTGAWTGRLGSSEGGRAHGTDRRKHLPGLYWANLFGPAYIDFFGTERLASAPAHTIRRGERSWVLLSSATPCAWRQPETVLCETKMREHLGSDAFFQLEKPDRPTRAPTFDVTY